MITTIIVFSAGVAESSTFIAGTPVADRLVAKRNGRSGHVKALQQILMGSAGAPTPKQAPRPTNGGGHAECLIQSMNLITLRT